MRTVHPYEIVPTGTDHGNGAEVVPFPVERQLGRVRSLVRSLDGLRDHPKAWKARHTHAIRSFELWADRAGIPEVERDRHWLRFIEAIQTGLDELARRRTPSITKGDR